MSRLHYCWNGRPVTDQVILYQETRDNKDYLPIQIYYDDYKDHWFSQIEDYMDRQEFESDFDYKLACAVNSFEKEKAKKLQVEKGYNPIGAFNGLFYQILSNWKSNIKTSSFRLKKRPAKTPWPELLGRLRGYIQLQKSQHDIAPLFQVRIDPFSAHPVETKVHRPDPPGAVPMTQSGESRRHVQGFVEGRGSQGAGTAY